MQYSHLHLDMAGYVNQIHFEQPPETIQKKQPLKPQTVHSQGTMQTLPLRASSDDLEALQQALSHCYL